MIELLQKYAESHNLLRDTVEETINAILEHLSKEPYNESHGAYRDELISSSAVVLNGLSRIKDPVKLFRNLGNAFERRGWCIYTNTVKNAFNRLYLNAVKMGKENEVIRVWKHFSNMHTKATASKYIPLKEFYPLLSTSDTDMLIQVAGNLVSRKDIPIIDLKSILKSTVSGYIKQKVAWKLASKKEIPSEYVYKLLHSSNNSIREGAASALSLRPDFPKIYLKLLLFDKSDIVKKSVAYSLILRKDLPANDVRRLLNNSNEYIKEGAREALAHRFDIPLSYIKDLPKHFSGDLPVNLVKYLALKLPQEKLKELLNNPNYKILQVALFAMVNRKDLPLDFVLNLTKSKNQIIKEKAYTALFNRPGISHGEVLELLNSESDNYIKYFRSRALKSDWLKHIGNIPRTDRTKKINKLVKSLKRKKLPKPEPR